MPPQRREPTNGMQVLLAIVACENILLGVMAALRPSFLTSEVLLCLVVANLAGLLSWRCRRDPPVPVKGGERFLIALVVLVFLGHRLTNSALGKEFLWEAVQKNDVKTMRLLLTFGAPRNSVALSTTVTPLNSALQLQHMGAVKLLLEAGADPNHKKRSQWSSLQIARMTGNQSAVALLLRYGAKDSISR